MIIYYIARIVNTLYTHICIHLYIKFRNALKGMIIGHFTVDEYEYYTAYASSLNKRMMNMAVERLKNQVEYFQPLKEKKVL